MRNTRVYVTGDGPAAIAFFEAIRSGSFDIFIRDAEPRADGLHLVRASCRLLLPCGDAPDCVEVMRGTCCACRIDRLVPTTDAERLSLAERAVDFGREGSRQDCLDQWRVIQSCADITAVPRSARRDANVAPDNRAWPVIVEPRRRQRVTRRPVRLVVVERAGPVDRPRPDPPGVPASSSPSHGASGVVVSWLPRGRAADRAARPTPEEAGRERSTTTPARPATCLRPRGGMRAGLRYVQCAALCVGLMLPTPALAQLELEPAVTHVLSVPEPVAVERPRPSDPSVSRSLPILEGAFVGLQALDVVSTLRAFDRGHVEANPLMRAVSTRPAAMVAAKAASSAATVWLVRRLAKRHRVAAVATMVAIDGAYAAIVARNLRVSAR